MFTNNKQQTRTRQKTIRISSLAVFILLLATIFMFTLGVSRAMAQTTASLKQKVSSVNQSYLKAYLKNMELLAEKNQDDQAAQRDASNALTLLKDFKSANKKARESNKQPLWQDTPVI